MPKSMTKQDGQTTARCPYCEHKLDKFPLRKAKCPKCGNFYYVRTDFRTRKKVILTESGVKDHEDARAHAMAVSNFGNRLAELDPEAFLSIEERMSNDIQSHSGKSLSREDQIWSLGNKMALEAMKRQDMDMLSQILWVQASYLYSQNKNYFPIMAKFHEIKLKLL